jgi:hypothetical protein
MHRDDTANIQQPYVCLEFSLEFSRPCFKMDSFRPTHVEPSNSLPPRSDSIRADLVVERPLIRSVHSPNRSHVYYDQDISSHKISPLPQIAHYSQGITSHPASPHLNSSLAEYSRSDQTQSQDTLSTRREVDVHEPSRPTQPTTGKKKMRLVSDH